MYSLRRDDDDCVVLLTMFTICAFKHGELASDSIRFA